LGLGLDGRCRQAVNAFSQSTALDAPRQGPAARLVVHARRSLPSLGVTLAGTAGWVLVMVASASLSVWMRGWQTPEKYQAIALLYALGAALGFPIALYLARFVSAGRSAEAAFAAMFLALSLSTLGITALLFALDYRSYYASWHEEFGTITRVFQLVFTTAAAVVQFAVLGVMMFLPLGLAALFIVSLWFARTSDLARRPR
jgi:hypothetical protein